MSSPPAAPAESSLALRSAAPLVADEGESQVPTISPLRSPGTPRAPLLSQGELVAALVDALGMDEDWRFTLLQHLRNELSSIFVPYEKLAGIHVGFDDMALHNPDFVLVAFQSALSQIASPFDLPYKMPRLRLTHLPQGLYLPLRNLRAEHVGHLYAFRGIIRKVTSVRSTVHEGVFECASCKQKVRKMQDPCSETVEVPDECDPGQNGCGKPASRARFKLLPTESTWDNVQHIELQEDPEGLGNAVMPESREVLLDADLCNSIMPGAHVVINGVPRHIPSFNKQGRRRVHAIRIEAASFDVLSAEEKQATPSEEEVEEIQALAHRPDVLEMLGKSFAPSVYGMERVKQALLLQQVGGLEMVLKEEGRVRGDIHVLLCGDPGIAKSHLVGAAANLHPRSVRTSGRGSSAAGLTASVTHDPFSGRWTVEAGAGVLADRALLICDEFEKMREEDRGAIHPMMEQGVVFVNKAGVNTSLNARTPVLAVANPKEGRFSNDEPLGSQIDLDVALLNRFDVIFALKDEHAHDEEMSAHILNQDERAPIPGAISTDLLRKYLTYARTRIRPRMSRAAKDRIRENYLALRRRGDGVETPVVINARQLQAMTRLATASAKLRLSPQVGEADADVAVNLYDHFLRTVCLDGGEMDLDATAAGRTKSSRDRQHDGAIIAADLTSKKRDWTEQDFLSEFVKKGHTEEQARKVLEELLRANVVMQPRHDTYCSV